MFVTRIIESRGDRKGVEPFITLAVKRGKIRDLLDGI